MSLQQSFAHHAIDLCTNIYTRLTPTHSEPNKQKFISGIAASSLIFDESEFVPLSNCASISKSRRSQCIRVGDKLELEIRIMNASSLSDWKG
jgi:hypothetical protein